MKRLLAAAVIGLLAVAGPAMMPAQVDQTGDDPYRPEGMSDPWAATGEDFPPPFGPFAVGGYRSLEEGYPVPTPVPPVPFEAPALTYFPEAGTDRTLEESAPVSPSTAYALPPAALSPRADDWQSDYPTATGDRLPRYSADTRRPEPPPAYAYEYDERPENADPVAGYPATHYRPENGQGVGRYEFRPWDESEVAPYPPSGSSAPAQDGRMQLPDYVLRPRFRPEDVGQGESPPSHPQYAPAGPEDGRWTYPAPRGSRRAPAPQEPWGYEPYEPYSARRSTDYGAGVPDVYPSVGSTPYPSSSDYPDYPYHRDVPADADPWAPQRVPGAYPNWYRGY